MMKVRPTTAATVSTPSRPTIDSQVFTISVWSNFEIGNLDLWRGEAYSKFFDFLDSKGGFYYEVSGLGMCEVCRFSVIPRHVEMG